MTTLTTLWEGGRGALGLRSQKSRVTAPSFLIANARLESRPTVRKQSVRLESNRKRIVISFTRQSLTPLAQLVLLALTNEGSPLAEAAKDLSPVLVLIYGSAIRNRRKPLKTQLDDYLRSTVKGVPCSADFAVWISSARDERHTGLCPLSHRRAPHRVKMIQESIGTEGVKEAFMVRQDFLFLAIMIIFFYFGKKEVDHHQKH